MNNTIELAAFLGIVAALYLAKKLSSDNSPVERMAREYRREFHPRWRCGVLVLE